MVPFKHVRSTQVLGAQIMPCPRLVTLVLRPVVTGYALPLGTLVLALGALFAARRFSATR